MMVGSVLTLSVAAIITWMNVNGLTTEDISLVDACYKSAQSKGINIETCDDLKDREMEWDSIVPCEKGYKEDIYFWTPRMMFVYLAGGQSDIAALGRTSKGQESQGVIYDAAMNLTFVEALEDRCNAMREETEYPFFVEGRRQYVRGVKIEDIDFSKFEDRNLYGWNQAWEWIFSSIGNCIAHAIPNDQVAADAVNYKACSVGLAFNALNDDGDYVTGPGGAQSEIYDHAECSGNNPVICKRYHHSGTDGWWTVNDRSGNNRLNNGCVGHDKCLNKCQKEGGACDSDLSLAAKKGVNWSWPGISCSWRGCRTWWFSWCNSMSDARFWSGCVWMSMSGEPNEGFGTPSGEECTPNVSDKCGGFCPPTGGGTVTVRARSFSAARYGGYRGRFGGYGGRY
jgi:hypothetical protein